MPIGFDRSDHPTHIPYLVVGPQVGWFRLQKVLMDGGSNIDILYAATLRCMGIPKSQLSPSNIQFHGIVPGKAARPMGRISLEVVFSEENNFRGRDPQL